MSNTHLPVLLLRVQQLQAEYLQQADSFTPTAAHVADWLSRMHGHHLPAVDPDTIAEGLPAQLLALPLFRHYLVSLRGGTARDFILQRLSPEQQPLFLRLMMPAADFSSVLHQWNDCLWHLVQSNYQMDLVQRNQPEEHARRDQATQVIGMGLPDMAVQFMTLCVLPPYGVENRKKMEVGGLHTGFTPLTVEAYPTMKSEQLLRSRIWALQPEGFSEAEADASLREFGGVLRSEGRVWVSKPAT